MIDTGIKVVRATEGVIPVEAWSLADTEGPGSEKRTLFLDFDGVWGSALGLREDIDVTAGLFERVWGGLDGVRLVLALRLRRRAIGMSSDASKRAGGISCLVIFAIFFLTFHCTPLSPDRLLADNGALLFFKVAYSCQDQDVIAAERTVDYV